MYVEGRSGTGGALLGAKAMGYLSVALALEVRWWRAFLWTDGSLGEGGGEGRDGATGAGFVGSLEEAFGGGVVVSEELEDLVAGCSACIFALIDSASEGLVCC